jgi:hypothetical protein
MVTVTVLHARSRHQIAQLVSEIQLGASFPAVASRLGPESQTLTNSEYIESYGTTKDASIVTNSTLHLFVYKAIPWRWICIYTDRDSQKVIYASWRDM